MKKGFIIALALLASTFALMPQAAAQTEAREGQVQDLGQIQVTAEGEKEAFTLSPSATILDLDDYQTIEIPQNVGDIMRDLVIFDFRGETDLVPGIDSFQMRGFNGDRFVTAIDGLTLRKTGGRKSSNIVDYAYLPPFLIEKMEVLPGPHSALYPAKSIGGVVNFISRAPKIHETLKPDISASSSIGTYNTQNHSVYGQGSIKALTYDAGYQNYATDGYLRNTEADIDTVFGRVGYVLPAGGYLALSASYADTDREAIVNNDPSIKASAYDKGYPKVSDSLFNAWQHPTWDGLSYNFRLNYRQPTPIGNLSGDAYYSEETRNRSYSDYKNSLVPSLGTYRVNMDTRWCQQGVKLQDDIPFSDRHMTTLEFDYAQVFDGDNKLDEKNDRMTVLGGAIQHRWTIFPRLTLTAGLRFEDDTIRVSNSSTSTSTGKYITGKPDWIERNFNAILPKSFLTYELDDLAPALRETSVSVGVSRVWRAPDWHGDYNPQGRPAGAWLDPEDGIGLDFVVTRKLFGDITVKADYSYYVIDDYIASNSRYAKYTPSKTNVVTPGLEYKDYKINLDQVVRHGIELELSGHLHPRFSFYLGYAFQDFQSMGDEPAGTNLSSDRAKHRINAGLRYKILDRTLLLLDWQFQDKQVLEVEEWVGPGEDDYIVRTDPIDAYQLLNFGIQQNIFEKLGPFSQGVLRFYVNNILDEAYEDSNGYPGTDRTVGIGISFKM